MKIYIFTDCSLDSGFLVTKGKNKLIKTQNIKDFSDILFVLPNELFTFIKHTIQLKNTTNLHASIINSINSVDLKDRSELKVFSANNNHNFFTATKKNLDLISDTFKHADTKIKLTSDLIFFRELFDTNIRFNSSIFYSEDEVIVKLSEQAFALLDTKGIDIIDKDINDLIITDANKLSFHEYDQFNIRNVFNYNAMKKFAYATLSLVIMLNLIGLINISSNWNQIKKMDDTLANLYLSIYPQEKINVLSEQITQKLSLHDEQFSTNTMNIIELLKNISTSTQIVEVTYLESSNQLINIKCLFKNISEESKFINQQKNNNLNVTIVDRSDSNDFLITEFQYEL